MKRVALVFLWLTLGLGAFVALALNREAVEPWLVAIGLDPEGSLFSRGILKGLALLMFGVPLTVLLWMIVGLGSNQGGTDIHGYTVLRLKTGGRVFLTLVSVGLAGLMLYVAMDESETLLFRLFIGAFGGAFLLGGYFIATAQVRYDNSTIAATTYTATLEKHEWRDLEAIEPNDEAREFVLRFRTGRKARISYFYQGVDELIWLARRKLDENAGIARGGNRAPGADPGHGRAAYR